MRQAATPLQGGAAENPRPAYFRVGILKYSMFSEYRTVCQNVLQNEMEETLKKERGRDMSKGRRNQPETDSAPDGQSWGKVGNKINNESSGV